MKKSKHDPLYNIATPDKIVEVKISVFELSLKQDRAKFLLDECKRQAPEAFNLDKKIGINIINLDEDE
jgi:hypothetical protein